jgi:hypothetical protein
LDLSRRAVLGAGIAGIATAALASPALAINKFRPVKFPGTVGLDPALLRRALAALEKHQADIPNKDLIAVADFSQASRAPRFHLVNVGDGKVSSFLVAHGKGSDPKHTGWLKSFSNAMGSEATSSGAYRTGDYYTGQHGRSMRLDGLDPSNNNAYDRAVVVHGAWYVSQDMVREHGVLGRSQGCFAFAQDKLQTVMERLGQGRMIYADRA